MNEAQKYRLLMLAFHHLADGKDLTHRIANENSLVVGSTSSTGEILAGMAFVSRKTFDPDDVAVVKAAFAKSGKQLHEPMQLQSWVGIFAQITPNSAPLRLHARLTDCAIMKECR